MDTLVLDVKPAKGPGAEIWGIIRALREEIRRAPKEEDLTLPEHSGTLCRYPAADYLQQKVDQMENAMKEKSSFVILNEHFTLREQPKIRRGMGSKVLLIVDSQGDGTAMLKYPSGFELKDMSQLLRIAKALKKLCDKPLNTEKAKQIAGKSGMKTGKFTFNLKKLCDKPLNTSEKAKQIAGKSGMKTGKFTFKFVSNEKSEIE